MLFGLLFVFLSVGFGYLAWRLWEIKTLLSHLKVQQQEASKHLPVQYNDIESTVKELHHTMGGVVNSLKVMGHQVQNLNMLTETMQDNLPEEGLEGEFQRPRILIEFHPGDGTQNSQLVMPDDVPPELMQRFQTFQSVYMAILNHPDWPSSHSPESN